MPPKRKRSSRTTTTTVNVVEVQTIVMVPSAEPETVEPEDEVKAPVPHRRASTRFKKPVNYAEMSRRTVVDGYSEGDAGYESPLTDLDDEPVEAVKFPQKRKRRHREIEPVVYDVPPVEKKITTFKGRLGYACLNTILRAIKPDPIFCSRTCRLDTIRKNGLDFAKNLGKQNAEDLCKLIQWNEENNIKFLRISSEMFPFASHGEMGYSLEYASEELKAAGDLANRLGHRLTSHPGQFTQLGSPREAVVTASVRELEYHCQMMRYMGLNQDSIIIIHMGGMYGDKESTLARFKENYQTKLTDEMKARLVLENDEICYNTDELLPICNDLNIPLVFDYHHNWINPSIHPVSAVIPLINATWHRKGIKPKQHLSSPRPGAETVMEKRAHADRCYELPPDLPDDMDLMIEAKDKEQAVLMLYRIYNLHPVVYENLRPEKPPKPFERSARKSDNLKEKEVIEDDGKRSESKGIASKNRHMTGKSGKKNVQDGDEGSSRVAPQGVGGFHDFSGAQETQEALGLASAQGSPTTQGKKSKPGRLSSNTKRKLGSTRGVPSSGAGTMVRMMHPKEDSIPVDGEPSQIVGAHDHPEVVGGLTTEDPGKELC